MLVNNTVFCDHFKSIVAGGGQNGKKETTCGRPSGDHQWASPSCKTLTPPPPFIIFFWHCAHSRIQSFNQYQIEKDITTFLSLWASFPLADIHPKMHIQGSIPDFRVGQVKGHVSLKMFWKYSTNGKYP